MHKRGKNDSKYVRTSTAIVLTLIAVVLSSALTYTLAASSSSIPFTIKGGLYPGAPDYTVWREGTHYFAKNSSGVIEFSNTNVSSVINQAINSLPKVTVKLPNSAGTQVSAPHGWIHVKAGEYVLTAPISIPLGSRLKFTGEGTTQQDIYNGINGGTQFIVTHDHGGLTAESTTDDVTTTGSALWIKDVEFVQNVSLAAGQACLSLDGMAWGKLENVQVTSYDKDVYGTGIKLYNNVGGDDAGATTIFEQVQVGGFGSGVNVRIDHWEAHSLDIYDCGTALIWNICLYNHIYNLHIFRCKKIISVYGGFTTYGYAAIDQLYLEDIDDNTETQKWYIDSGFHGMLHIKGVNVDSSSSTYLWGINTDNNAKCKIWFENVVAVSSVSFPSVSTPTLTSGSEVKNDKMQAVQVYIRSSTTTDKFTLIVNGDTVGSFIGVSVILRPGDRIKVSYTVTTYWSWEGYSAERYHYDD